MVTIEEALERIDPDSRNALAEKVMLLLNHGVPRNPDDPFIVEAYAFYDEQWRQDPAGWLTTDVMPWSDVLDQAYPGLRRGDPDTVPPEIWTLAQVLDEEIRAQDFVRDEFQRGIAPGLATIILTTLNPGVMDIETGNAEADPNLSGESPAICSIRS